MATQAMTPVMLSSIVVLRNTFNRRFSMESLGEDEGKQREENLLLLRLFYLLPYEGTIDFYTQFTERMEHWNGQNGQI